MLSDDYSMQAVAAAQPAEVPRARHSRAWWQAHYQAWQASGQSKAQFCRERGLKYNSFDSWCRKLRDAGPKQPTDNGSTFVPARLVSSASSARVTVSVGDVSVRFDEGLQADELGPWVAALRQLSC